MCCSDSLCSDCQEKIEHILISYKQKEQEVQAKNKEIQELKRKLEYANNLLLEKRR